MRLRQRTNTITHQNCFHITGKQIRTPLNTRITIKTQDTRFARLQSIVIFQIAAHFPTVERSIYIIFIIIERQRKFHHWYQQKVGHRQYNNLFDVESLKQNIPPIQAHGKKHIQQFDFSKYSSYETERKDENKTF